MQETISGRVFVVGDNVSAGEILGEDYAQIDPQDPEAKRVLGMYALLGVRQKYGELMPVGQEAGHFPILVAGLRFGWGRGPANAAAALAGAGVRIVVAESYGEDFLRNAVNTGSLLPLRLDVEDQEGRRTGRLCERVARDSIVSVSPAGRVITLPDGTRMRLEASDLERRIIAAGGLLKRRRGLDGPP